MDTKRAPDYRIVRESPVNDISTHKLVCLPEPDPCFFCSLAKAAAGMRDTKVGPGPGAVVVVAGGGVDEGAAVEGAVRRGVAGEEVERAGRLVAARAAEVIAVECALDADGMMVRGLVEEGWVLKGLEEELDDGAEEMGLGPAANIAQQWVLVRVRKGLKGGCSAAIPELNTPLP